MKFTEEQIAELKEEAGEDIIGFFYANGKGTKIVFKQELIERINDKDNEAAGIVLRNIFSSFDTVEEEGDEDVN